MLQVTHPTSVIVSRKVYLCVSHFLVLFVYWVDSFKVLFWFVYLFWRSIGLGFLESVGVVLVSFFRRDEFMGKMMKKCVRGEK